MHFIRQPQTLLPLMHISMPTYLYLQDQSAKEDVVDGHEYLEQPAPEGGGFTNCCIFTSNWTLHLQVFMAPRQTE